MASDEGAKTINGAGKRPSRLLNLNNSPRAQKLLGATNAATSPFLLLPPEIRCRIYDYVFCDLVVHISANGNDNRPNLNLALCQSPQQCTPLLFQNNDRRVSCYDTFDTGQGCSQKIDSQRVAHRKIPLHVLQVSRQIYHEAVLKPFTQVTFHIRTEYWQWRELRRMLPKILVPAQVKAIARFCVTCVFGGFMDRRLLNKFEGLKHIHLHIQTFTMAVDDLYPLRELQSFVRMSSLERLANVHLKSFRISVSIAGPHCKDRLKNCISEWIQLQEDEVLPRSLLTAE